MAINWNQFPGFEYSKIKTMLREIGQLKFKVTSIVLKHIMEHQATTPKIFLSYFENNLFKFLIIISSKFFTCETCKLKIDTHVA